MNKLLN